MGPPLLLVVPALTWVAALLAAAAIVLAVPGRPRLRPRGPSGAPGLHAAPAATSGASPSPVSSPRSPWWRGVAAGGLALAVVALLPNPLGVALAAGVAGAVWRASKSWESAAELARREALERDLPHVVDLMVATLAVGLSPAAALARTTAVVDSPMREELRMPCAKLALGTDPVTVWAELSRHPQLARLGAALHRATESGAPVGAALTRLADDLRGQRRAVVASRVRQVEVRTAVPLAACLLPAFVLLAVVPLVAGTASQLLAS